MTALVHKDRLANGLRVVTAEAPHLHSAMVTVYVRLGSRQIGRASCRERVSTDV